MSSCVRRRAYTHPLHQIFQSRLLSVCTPSFFRRLNSPEKLSTFTSSIFNKTLHVLLQRIDRVPHLLVEHLCSVQARLEVCVRLIDFAILAQDGIPLAREGFVLVLFSSYTLILKKLGVGSSELLH